MNLSKLHATLLGQAFHKMLGNGEPGSLAFVRFLTGDIVEALSDATDFQVAEWQVWRVADADDEGSQTITADRAVELREAKSEPVLLLVDTALAGAGMDGIYSAARELDEGEFFRFAHRLAAKEVTRRLSPSYRSFAKRAVKKAGGSGRRVSISPWAVFDFYVHIADEQKHPGAFLHLIELWPVEQIEEINDASGLEISILFINRLLGPASSGMTPAKRIEALRLLNPTRDQKWDLEDFIRTSATKSMKGALAELADKPGLWINALKLEGGVQEIQDIELTPWRVRTGKIAKWSGLVKEGDVDDPPVLIIYANAEKTSNYSKLEIRWKAHPENLEKGSVEYQITVVTDMDEELTSTQVRHSAKKEEKCHFTNDDFAALSEDTLINAKVVVSVMGNDTIEAKESEEFKIRFGEPLNEEKAGVGKKVRTFGEGLIELEDREMIANFQLPEDAKGFVSFRIPQLGKSFRVFRPSLIREVEHQWFEKSGTIGRWRMKIRSSGVRAGTLEFVPFSALQSSLEPLWERSKTASRRLAEHFISHGGGVGQVYEEKSKAFEHIVKEFLLSWAALLAQGSPTLALVNTVEVQSLSGRTIGLIVLPSHPLRVAWHVAYDNLILHARFEQGMPPKEIEKELALLDGSMFPAFLPGLDGKSTFVFADTLGFHAVGMVLDREKEPKAALTLLSRAMGEDGASDVAPTVGMQSAEILGNEIMKYLECHDVPRLLHIHALRPGDGLTVARSLGRVYKHYQPFQDEEETEEETRQTAPAFVLELYPSHKQKGVAGRFISEAREKRRSGAGALSLDDRWMLESLALPGGINLPNLRWARKDIQDPETAAHLAVAFDTFESQVVCVHLNEFKDELPRTRPIYAFGLLSFFERRYACDALPLWQSYIPAADEGEKHPSDRFHTERLQRIQQAIQKCVVRNLGETDRDQAILRTEIGPDKEENLKILHELCDWVITVDRNAGIEYFDSPRENREIYEAYVIDCVPEREDLGCLQLITSTSNIEEVRNLLDHALDQMGLSRSRRNAEFLLENLKGLSGRLAIRLTGQKEKAPTSELIALALCYANCREPGNNEDKWLSLRNGFFIPVDDVRDLLPRLNHKGKIKEENDKRPDLVHVSIGSRRTLLFKFVEVKYRRHLRSARNITELELIRKQVEPFRKRWETWFGNEVFSACRAVRRAKLARVLRFYADKARRHYLSKESHRRLVSEIDRMIRAGGTYTIDTEKGCDRGFVFCPEFNEEKPRGISPSDWETKIFLFGPGFMPDSDLRQAQSLRSTPSVNIQNANAKRPDNSKDNAPSIPEAFSDDQTPVKDFLSTTRDHTSQDPAIISFGKDILTNSKVDWELTTKGNPHLMIVGLPGMGKTTCLLNLCKQMLQNKISPIVFSYHQDIDEQLESAVDSVRFIDFDGLGFNPLQVLDRQSKLAYLGVAGAMRDIFIAIFPDLGDIQGEHIRQAVKQSFIETGWGDAEVDLSTLQEPDFKRFYEILHDHPKPDRGLKTLLVRLEELADYGFFDLGTIRGSLWESEKPTIVRIHSSPSDNLQRAFASLVFYGLYKDMFRRGLKASVTHGLIFDEAHRAAGLKLIPTMAKECRKYGISLVLASQEVRDFNVSLFSAIDNYLVLRLTDVDAKALVRNVATSDQARALTDRIKQMDKFKALYFSEGRKRPAYTALCP